MTPRLFSFGGGVQSTAVLVLASQGRVQYDAFVFANVGEDSEHPDTIAYLHQVAMPFAQRHNIELLELRRETGDGKTLLVRNSSNCAALKGGLNRKPCMSSHSSSLSNCLWASVSTPSAMMRKPKLQAMQAMA